MMLSYNQMRQAFDVWIKMPHEKRRNGPLVRIAVPVEGGWVDDYGRTVTHIETSSWDIAVWGVAYLSSALEDMRKARNSADEEAARLTIELAEAQRQVEALVKAAQNVPCAYCEARDFCDNRDPGLTCPEHLLAWSVEEAKKGA
jgi:hypothetical protein